MKNFQLFWKRRLIFLIWWHFLTPKIHFSITLSILESQSKMLSLNSKLLVNFFFLLIFSLNYPFSSKYCQFFFVSKNWFFWSYQLTFFCPRSINSFQSQKVIFVFKSSYLKFCWITYPLYWHFFNFITSRVKKKKKMSQTFFYQITTFLSFKWSGK